MKPEENQSIKSIKDLYQEFQQPIYRYLLRLSGSHQAAEDLTQETFYQAVMSIYRFKGNSKASTWLYKIARNTYLNEKKHQIKTIKLEQKMESQVENYYAGQPTPDKSFEKKLIAEKVHHALQLLPEHYRTVILLREYEELSHAEISKVINKTPASSKVLLYRAKQKFKEEYLRLEGKK